MLSFIRNNYHYEVKLYNKILSFSRNKYFYDQIRLADTYQVRILLIFFHFSFLIINLKKKKSDLNSKKISQKIFDFMFKRIEEDMRELGFGDVGVNKNMKILVNKFYNILLNFENYMEFDNEKKIDLFNKYVLKESDGKNLRLPELIKYFNKYQSFCFDLSLNSVIKGDFNFKY